MTIGYVLNQRPLTYGAALSLLVEMLATAGWTYRASGAGTGQSYSSTGKVFTNTGSGSTGWSNSGAWARMQDPGGGRELVFQHDNFSSVVIKYSSSAKFIGGAPAAGVTPAAADQVYLWGAGPDASPSYGGQWFQPHSAHIGGSGGNIVYQGAAKDTAPYGFWFCSQQVGAANGTTAMSYYSTLMMDPVISVPEDPDPVVFHVADGSNFNSDGFYWAMNQEGGQDQGSSPYPRQSGGTNIGTFGYMDAAKTRFLFLAPSQYATGLSGQSGGTSGSNTLWPRSGQASNGWLAPNSFSGKQDMLPFFYMRLQNGTTERPGIKGWSTLCRFSSIQANFRETTANKAWISLGALWLPWDGVTVPIQ